MRLLLRTALALPLQRRLLGTAAAVFPDVKLADTDPLSHAPGHEYQVFPLVPTKTHALSYGLPHEAKSQLVRLGSLNVLLRAPTLQLLDHLRGVQSSSPSFKRLLLHGREGCGKSIGLTHAEHFCQKAGWLVVRLPRAFNLTHRTKALEQSTHNPERYDQNAEATEFLQDVNALNAALLNKLPLKGSYKWGRRAMVLPPDTSLGQLVQLGLHDVRHATDVTGVLLKELALLGTDTRVLYAVDEFNALLETHAVLRAPGERRPIACERLPLWRTFNRLVQPAFQPKNGALVLASSLSHNAAGMTYSQAAKAFMAAALRGENGFTALEYKPYDAAEAAIFLKQLREAGWLAKDVNATLLNTLKLQTDFVPRSLTKLASAF